MKLPIILLLYYYEVSHAKQIIYHNMVIATTGMMTECDMTYTYKWYLKLPVHGRDAFPIG